MLHLPLRSVGDGEGEPGHLEFGDRLQLALANDVPLALDPFEMLEDGVAILHVEHTGEEVALDKATEEIDLFVLVFAGGDGDGHCGDSLV